MVISASRRTDIPAFYSKWVLNRLREGYLYVRNPMNYHQVGRVNLNPEAIDCIVFWTKNPQNIIDKLDAIDEMGYKYFFQFTLNPYDDVLEKNLPPQANVISSFRQLSEKLGKHRVIWRYDPILLTDSVTKEYHYKNFEYLAKCLSGFTKQCIISFLDLYVKTQRNMKHLKLQNINEADMLEMAGVLAEIAKGYSLEVKSCAEAVDLSSKGVTHARCIDDSLISKLIGCSLTADKDKNQRKECGCIESIDIGAYNTCKNGCVYCYANFSPVAVKNNCRMHDENSPLLIGSVGEGDRINVRKVKSFKNSQISLF
jgi:DNA repair photolyase